MRIIAGRLGGLTFASPKGHRTHPMSDKVRGGLFSVLGDISGLSVLDVFAGSGAISFESISRGAKFAQAIEIDKNAHTAIEENIVSLKLDNQIKASRVVFGAWSARNVKQKFDLIIADPPFDNIPFKEIKKLPRHLNETGTIVLSWPGNLEPLKLEKLNQVQIKNYGDAQLVFYKNIS